MKIVEKDMFKGLMHLVATQNGAFTKADSEMGGVKYRVFNYRIPSWTQMQLPYAQESRGVMFDVTDEENPRLVCLTPKKFFNYKEGQPKEHEKHKLGVKMVKVDGSLISSFEHKGKVFFKSKNSINSTQVKDSLELLYKDAKLSEEAMKFQKDGWTMNFEYVSPTNTVVLVYEKPELILLSARNLQTGELIYADKLENKLKSMGLNTLASSMVSYEMIPEHEQNQKELVNKIGKETVGEGYVIEVLAPEPYLVKVKNDAYTAIHHFLEKMESNFHLAKVILHEKADDARSLFRDNPDIIERIEELEQKILPVYNAIVAEVESFYEKHKDLDMKAYVLAAQEKDKDGEFKIPLASFKVQRVKNIDNIKKFCMDNPGKVFGIKESPIKESPIKIQENETEQPKSIKP